MENDHPMSEVQAVIDARQRALAEKPLFRALDASSDIEDLRAIAPHGYFYVFGFQDMLRLTHEEVVDASMRDLARSLRDDDAGHENWFAEDTRVLDIVRDVPWVFGDAHRFTRDMVYHLISELLAAKDDRVRIVFPLVLESAGAIFFGAMVGLVRRTDYDPRLKYFARSHQEAEEAHQVFEEPGQEQLAKIEFDEGSYADAIRLVHACFDWFDRFADHLQAQRAARTKA